MSKDSEKARVSCQFLNTVASAGDDDASFPIEAEAEDAPVLSVVVGTLFKVLSELSVGGDISLSLDFFVPGQQVVQG